MNNFKKNILQTIMKCEINIYLFSTMLSIIIFIKHNKYYLN